MQSKTSKQTTDRSKQWEKAYNVVQFGAQVHPQSRLTTSTRHNMEHPLDNSLVNSHRPSTYRPVNFIHGGNHEMNEEGEGGIIAEENYGSTVAISMMGPDMNNNGIAWGESFREGISSGTVQGTHYLENMCEADYTVRAIHLGKGEKWQWLEHMTPLSDYRHSNINRINGIVKSSKRKTKFSIEPSWASDMDVDDVYAVIMERTFHGNIKDWTAANQFQPFPLKRKMSAARQVASGMDFLHSRNPPVIHHNLTSSNVSVFQQNCVKISDYFLGNRMMKEYYSEYNNVKDGHMKSAYTCPYWMAPEILENEEGGIKSDVYSYGMLSMESVNGTQPFSDITSMDESTSSVCIKEERPQLQSPVPQTLDTLIQRCLNQRPEDRPTFQQILIDFDVLLTETVLEDKVASSFWNSSFRGQDFVGWRDFIVEFHRYFKIEGSPMEKDNTMTTIMHHIMADSDEAVTIENFCKVIQWFGPLDGFNFMKRISDIHEESWFHGNLSSIQAEDVSQEKARGTFLVRYSASHPGNYAISVNGEEGIVKHYKVWHRPGGGYSLGKEQYPDSKALIAGRTELLNLRFPCVKGERYSDSNFWTTHETDESNSTKTVVSLKKSCYRFIYRNTQSYPKISDVSPHDLMEHYRCTFVDSITSDEAGRVLWKEYWSMEDDVPFNTFVSASSDMLKIEISQGSTHYITLESSVRDIADSDSERITIETFSKLSEWFGPLDGQFLDKIAKIITKPWFHGNMTHMQAEKHIMKYSGTKKGTYLIRFSSKNRGYFTITVIGRNRTSSHYRVYYNRSEAKYNIGRSGFGSLDEIITNYSRELWSKMPCPGSKFATSNL